MNQKLTSLTEKQIFRFLFSILCVIFSALLQTYALKAFLRPAGLLSSGFTGLAILINVIGSQHNIQIPISLMIVLLNLPLCFHPYSHHLVQLSFPHLVSHHIQRI